MSFKDNNYLVIKEIIPKDLAIFLNEYFLLKRKVARTLLKTNYISAYEECWGIWSDQQVPGTYSHYADIAMETLLLKVKPIMEKETGLELVPTYSYARIYKKGDVLEKHRDRPSCEISTTLNLGGDDWPIFIESGHRVDLKPGDMLIYRGCILEHWREAFEGDSCTQVFLHYNNKATFGLENEFDTRDHLGLPAVYKIK